MKTIGVVMAITIEKGIWFLFVYDGGKKLIYFRSMFENAQIAVIVIFQKWLIQCF